MRIRPAAPADAEQIERIRVRGWQVAYRAIFPPDQLDAMLVDASRWVRWLERGSEHGQTCIVGEEHGAMLGWATFGPPRDADERFGELHGLYVDPDAWGHGAGRTLLARAEAELSRAWDEAVLWTLADNPRTRRFYEANGWRPDGITGSFDLFGVSAPTVRYAKRLKSSTSRG